MKQKVTEVGEHDTYKMGRDDIPGTPKTTLMVIIHLVPKDDSEYPKQHQFFSTNVTQWEEFINFTAQHRGPI